MNAEQIIEKALKDYFDLNNTDLWPVGWTMARIDDFIAARLRLAGVDLDHTYEPVICANGWAMAIGTDAALMHAFDIEEGISWAMPGHDHEQGSEPLFVRRPLGAGDE